MIFTENATWGQMKSVLIKESKAEKKSGNDVFAGVPVAMIPYMPDNQLFSDKTIPELPEQDDEEED